ncbi:hypothetical protein O6H91_20G072000 [Diphasiastrum complanatum]|uniref:Uncharacterized protein n=1 Tax=Diphasiastrum complanatum TaxID=34168 RepID=A0ACC2ART0_DIPCM|nr:hypothetical protein O6H91_20G072000 [Diphasiastrum complanatum]
MQQKELEEEHRQSSHGQLQTEYVRDSSTALEGVRSTQGDGISTTVGYQTAGIMPAGTGSGQGSTVPSSAYLRHNRDEFNIDLEDIMVMEAIWLSIQEQEESQRHFEPNLQGPLSIDISSHCASAQGRNTNYSMEGQANVVNPGDASERSSLTGGLAGVIAKLAERHVTGGSSPETQSFDPADGFGSFGTHTDFQLERPPTNDDVELGEELNEVFEDSRNPMTSLERNTDTLDDDNDQLLKAALEGSSRTERTHPCDMHASCCESDDIGKVDRDSSRYQEACPSSMSNQSSQKFSDEVLGARSEAVRPIETRICGDTTFFKLSSQGLTTAYEQAYDNPVEGGGMSLVPKNFEEQMRLAMALSLAEAQTESGFRLGEEGSCQILNNTS